MNTVEGLIERIDYALGKFDWGKSALDAKAIGYLNTWRGDMLNIEAEISELKCYLDQLVLAREEGNDIAIDEILSEYRTERDGEVQP